MAVLVFLLDESVSTYKKCRRSIRFTRLVTFDHARFVPSLCQVAKFELGSTLPSSRNMKFLVDTSGHVSQHASTPKKKEQEENHRKGVQKPSPSSQKIYHIPNSLNSNTGWLPTFT